MDDPRLSGLELAAQPYDLRIAFDYMKQQRFAQVFAQEYVEVKHRHLRVKIRMSLYNIPIAITPLPFISHMNRIKPCLTYRHNPRIGGERPDPSLVGSSGYQYIPRMNPHGIHITPAKVKLTGIHGCGIKIDHSIAMQVMGMIVYHHGRRDQGTGS